MVKVNYTAVVKQLMRSMCVLAILLTTGNIAVFSQDPCSLACNGSTQVSVASDCEIMITVDMILNGQMSSCPDGGPYGLIISDQFGNVIATDAEPMLTENWMYQTLTATVVDSTSGNTCWGNLILEDKIGPTSDNCGLTIEYSCTDFNDFDGPLFTDGCEGRVEPILISEVINPIACNDDYVKEIIRTYTAIDSHGNYGEECTITYLLTRIDLDDIDCPRSYTIDNGDPLSCDGIRDNPATLDSIELWDLDGDLYPDIEEFPVPRLNGIDLFPFPDIYCNVGIFYQDLELPKVGCIKKVMRTWSIREWHCGDEVPLDCIQVFDITDLEDPEIVCDQSVIIVTTNTTSNPHDSYNGIATCGADILFPLPKITDNCSELIHVDLTLIDADTGDPYEHINNYDPNDFISLPMGENLILITAFDQCYNSSTCEVIVDVVDDTPPAAICDEFTVVALTSDGTANVFAETFDDGSYDDCLLKKKLVRRMDNTNCECDIPSYPDVHYIGEYNEHYYYVSHKEVTGRKAHKLSEAMGGYAVSINDKKENDWVRETVTDKVGQGMSYHIGYNDVLNEGNFVWADGSNSTYANWAPGMPSPGIIGGLMDYVIVRPNGGWHDVLPTTKNLYVFEVEDKCTFSDYTKFCCEDVDPNVDHMVVFRVVDICGNFNDCMVNVEVQDKLAPILDCPPNVTRECDFEYSTNTLEDLEQFFGGVATNRDNCTSTMTYTVIDNLDQCNIGELIIKYTATDDGGRTGFCDHIITFINSDPFTEEQIMWPEDVDTLGCFDPDDYHPDFIGYPEFLDDQCDLVGSNWDDKLFVLNDQPDNACFKILRTWQVIDWCQRDINDDIFTWDTVQIIKIGNHEGPAVACPDDIVVCTFDQSCDFGTVNLTLSTTGDDCTEPDNILWKFEIDLHCDGSIDSVSTTNYGPVADASDSYPLGTHCIFWQFTDQCGNPTTCYQQFTVFNCKSPTPYCINGLAVDLMPVDTNNDGIEDWGMVEMWASDFDAGSFHPCGYPVILSFQQDTTIKNIMLDCTTLGRQTIEIWASIVLPDGSLVQSYCETYVEVQDNNNVCPDNPGTGGATGGDGVEEGEEEENEGGESAGEEGEEVIDQEFKIQGRIATEDNAELANVSVALGGADIDALMTDDLGAYIFPNMPLGGQYMIDPSKIDDPMNGVSTLDLVEIQKHILGLQELNSPYKIIAADINKDNKVTSLDLIQLRKMILDIITDFPNNDSWRFVDQEYSFNNSTEPLKEIFTEEYGVNYLETDMNVDFVAVKIGDVNNTVIANLNNPNIGSRSLNTTSFKIKESELMVGQNEVTLYAGQDIETFGFQFSVEFSQSIEVTDVHSSTINFDATNMSVSKFTNVVNVSWNVGELVSISEGQELITFSINDPYGKLNPKAIAFNKDLNPELYSIGSEITTPVIDLEYIKGNEITYDYKLFQNTPNPFTGRTDVRFTLPKDMQASLVISDLNGRVIYKTENFYSKGINILELDSEILNTTGVLYYTLESEDWKSTKKMVVIK